MVLEVEGEGKRERSFLEGRMLEGLALVDAFDELAAGRKGDEVLFMLTEGAGFGFVEDLVDVFDGAVGPIRSDFAGDARIKTFKHLVIRDRGGVDVELVGRGVLLGFDFFPGLDHEVPIGPDTTRRDGIYLMRPVLREDRHRRQRRDQRRCPDITPRQVLRLLFDGRQLQRHRRRHESQQSHHCSRWGACGCRSGNS